ncbi:MAG: hypothetical protein J6M92_13070 [Oribacterium sp.]|nr:hypothetical protein [Oribacterium sp.]
MLNEFMEFESYICSPQSDKPRLQPKLLTGDFKKKESGYVLNGIDQVLTVIVRGVLFDAQYAGEIISDDAIAAVKELLNCWCGFEKVNIKNQTIKNWFIEHKDADGWLKQYWIHWFRKSGSKLSKMPENRAEEEWKELTEKWQEKLNSDQDYQAESFTFGNVIADALEAGPLKERYCVIKKTEKKIELKKKKELYDICDQIFDYSGKRGPQDQTKLKMLRNIIAFRIRQEEHPCGQEEVLLQKIRLLGWYGNDDRGGHKEVWCFDDFFFQGKNIMYSRPGKDFSKYGIDEDFLKEYEFKLIERGEAEKYRDKYWILKDTGYGEDKPLEILNL